MAHLEYQKRTTHIFSEIQCHFHGVYEIYYFVSGDAEIIVDAKRYKLTPHSLVLIAPHIPHGIQVNSTADYVRYCLYLQAEDVLPERRYLLDRVMYMHKGCPGTDIFYENTESYHLEEFFSHLQFLYTQPEEIRDSMEPIYIEALLAQINIICRELRPSTLLHGVPDKIIEATNYINVHLTEDLSLDQIASTLFISKNYLNRSFKEITGTTLMDYVRLKRILLAKHYMQQGESAINAALQVGFSDYSSFYRAYIKYLKATPSEDLKRKITLK